MYAVDSNIYIYTYMYITFNILLKKKKKTVWDCGLKLQIWIYWRYTITLHFNCIVGCVQHTLPADCELGHKERHNTVPYMCNLETCTPLDCSQSIHSLTQYDHSQSFHIILQTPWMVRIWSLNWYSSGYFTSLIVFKEDIMYQGTNDVIPFLPKSLFCD